MQIVACTPDMSSGLVELYNSVAPGLPHCYPATEADMAGVLAELTRATAPDDSLVSQAAFAARKRDRLIGLIHVGIEPQKQAEDAGQGIIRSFLYRPGLRAAAQSLLERAEAHLFDLGVKRITAFHQDYRYPFYHMGHAYLSDRLGHVHALMGLNGYERTAGEVYLDWPDYKPREPMPSPVQVEVSVQTCDGKGTRPGLTILAHSGGELVGECVNLSGGEFSGAEQAQDWFLTKWLGVAESFQGKGLGRYLLQRALNELHAIGYKHAAISTSWTNFRAALFYSNFGYHVVDWTYALAREA